MKRASAVHSVSAQRIASAVADFSGSCFSMDSNHSRRAEKRGTVCCCRMSRRRWSSAPRIVASRSKCSPMRPSAASSSGAGLTRQGRKTWDGHQRNRRTGRSTRPRRTFTARRDRGIRRSRQREKYPNFEMSLRMRSFAISLGGACLVQAVGRGHSSIIVLSWAFPRRALTPERISPPIRDVLARKRRSIPLHDDRLGRASQGNSGTARRRPARAYQRRTIKASVLRQADQKL